MEFKHSTRSYTDPKALQQARCLWQSLEHLTATEQFRNLFGNVMIALNMFPRHIDDPKQRMNFTYAVMVLKFERNVQHIVDVSDSAFAFMGDSA